MAYFTGMVVPYMAINEVLQVIGSHSIKALQLICNHQMKVRFLL